MCFSNELACVIAPYKLLLFLLLSFRLALFFVFLRLPHSRCPQQGQQPVNYLCEQQRAHEAAIRTLREKRSTVRLFKGNIQV